MAVRLDDLKKSVFGAAVELKTDRFDSKRAFLTKISRRLFVPRTSSTKQ